MVPGNQGSAAILIFIAARDDIGLIEKPVAIDTAVRATTVDSIFKTKLSLDSKKEFKIS